MRRKVSFELVYKKFVSISLDERWSSWKNLKRVNGLTEWPFQVIFDLEVSKKISYHVDFVMLKLLLLRRRLFSHGSRNFIEFKLLNRLRYFKRLHVYKISSIPGNIQGPAFRLATVLQQRGTETHVRCSSSFYTSAFCPSFKLFRERVKWSQFTDELVRFSQFSSFLKEKRRKRIHPILEHLCLIF